MKKINGDNFDSFEKYKLYRNVYDILHPTISKKNISNYKVVFEDKLLPVLVFYPKKVSDLKKCIIMVPGSGDVTNGFNKYSEICRKMAYESDSLVIVVDYFTGRVKHPTTSNKVFKIIKYLYEELEKNGICSSNITIIGDSVGCIILNDAISKLIVKGVKIERIVFFYPVCRNSYKEYDWDEKYLSINFNLDKKVNSYLDKYFSKSDRKEDLLDNEYLKDILKVLVITGDMDIFKDDGMLLAEKHELKYKNIGFAAHGFLSSEDEEVELEVYKTLKEFVM